MKHEWCRDERAAALYCEEQETTSEHTGIRERATGEDDKAAERQSSVSRKPALKEKENTACSGQTKHLVIQFSL